jgi:hypothetical protein
MERQGGAERDDSITAWEGKGGERMGEGEGDAPREAMGERRRRGMFRWDGMWMLGGACDLGGLS